MADFSEYIHVLGVETEPFSHISFSGAAFYGDAALGRAVAARIWQEKTTATELLLAKLGVMIFTIDIPEDLLYYQRILPDGTRYDRKVSNFSVAIEKVMDGGDVEGRKLAEAIGKAMKQEMKGEIRFRAALFTQRVQNLEAVFRSTKGQSEHMETVTGYIMSGDALDCIEVRDGSSSLFEQKLYNRDELRPLVNANLGKLLPGEKGVLFQLSVQAEGDGESGNLKELRLRAVVDAIRADFRSGDVLGQIAEDKLVLFICGSASIDIIERRAQRMIDLCRRVPSGGAAKLSYSIGIAASGSPEVDFEMLMQQAEKALAAAQKHGSNQYRLFEECE